MNSQAALIKETNNLQPKVKSSVTVELVIIYFIPRNTCFHLLFLFHNIYVCDLNV